MQHYWSSVNYKKHCSTLDLTQDLSIEKIRKQTKICSSTYLQALTLIVNVHIQSLLVYSLPSFVHGCDASGSPFNVTMVHRHNNCSSYPTHHPQLFTTISIILMGHWWKFIIVIQSYRLYCMCCGIAAVCFLRFLVTQIDWNKTRTYSVTVYSPNPLWIIKCLAQYNKICLN